MQNENLPIYLQELNFNNLYINSKNIFYFLKNLIAWPLTQILNIFRKFEDNNSHLKEKAELMKVITKLSENEPDRKKVNLKLALLMQLDQWGEYEKLIKVVLSENYVLSSFGGATVLIEAIDVIILSDTAFSPNILGRAII